LFIKRAGIYGGIGGMLVGTLFFGNPDLAMRRAISKYYYWTKMTPTDPRN
jgi:hypothetical protein